MFKQKMNLFFFSLFSFAILCSGSLHAAGVGVKGMFQNMSEEELAAQVQQGEDLMHYMETQATPEERQAFEEAMAEMFNQLSPEDLEEINAIAEAVDGKIQIHDREEPKKAEPVKAKAKSKKVSADGTIKSLLIAINNIIDTIMRKVESDLLLSDYFSSHSIKSSIALFQRLISLLESKENIKRLSDKKDKENQKLIDELKEFKDKLDKKDKEFHIDDSFGASSKKSHKDNVRKLDAIIEDFHDGLEDIMPKIEKFIRKYEAEDKELAALYDKLKAASAKHAKSAQRKQGSKPAKATPPKRTAAQPPAQSGSGGQGGGSNGGYYDPYYDDYYNDPYGKGEDSDKNKKPQEKKKKSKGSAEKKEQSEEDRTLDQIIDKIEEYLEAYDEKDVKAAEDVHRSASAKHIKLDAPTTGNIDELHRAIVGFCNKSLAHLEQFEEDRNKVLEANLGNLATTLNNCQQLVGKLDLHQIKKLKDNAPYKEIIKRTKQYVSTGENFIKEAKKTNDSNVEFLKIDLRNLTTQVEASGTTPDKAKLKDAEESIRKLEAENKNMIKSNKALYRKVQDFADVFERSVRSAERRRKRSKKPGTGKRKSREEELEEKLLKQSESKDA